MSRVEWSRRSPEEVEELLGILLCSRYGLSATRVRPSRGDKGIDVFVLTPEGWVVFQIKSFTTSMTASHKRQLTESWTAFSTYAEEESIPIKAWYVVRPLNPTLEDRGWLESLTGGASFTCGWQGLDFCETLASEFPAVVDYYLFDGKERLDATIRQYLELIGLQRREADEGLALEPAGSRDALASVHRALNAFDPFFRYDFSVSDASQGIPDIDLNAPSAPGLVASVTSSDGKIAVTFHILERFKDAALERPIPGSFVPEVTPGSAEAEAWSDFVKYGLPIAELPLMSMSVDLPGGLGVSDAQHATATIGPARRSETAPPELLLRILGSADEVVAEATIRTEPPSVGITGEGMAVGGVEASGVFDFVLKGDRANDVAKFEFDMNSLVGAIPGAVLDGISFLAACRPPNRFEAWFAHGPVLLPAQEIGTGFGDADELHDLRIICSALAEIQRHTHLPIRVPEVVSNDDANDWLLAAKLLRGEEARGTWTEMPLGLEPGATLPGATSGQFQVVVAVPLTVVVDGLEVHLGRRQIHCLTAQVDPASVTAESVRLVPGDDNAMVQRWLADGPTG